MNSTDAVVSILLTLFMAGGPVVAWINARAAKQPTITTKEVELQATTTAAKELGIEERWRAYADNIEVRLNARVDGLERELHETRLSRDRAYAYAAVLRGHIHEEKGPPAPPWPSDLN